jgi:yeast amino acid transporter
LPYCEYLQTHFAWNGDFTNGENYEYRIAIPIATISYIGVEIVAVAAFEAAKPSELQKPAKNIALVTVIFYVVSVGGIAANVEWFNESLETLLSQSLVNVTSPDTNLGHTPMFIGTVYPVVAAPIIAALQVNATKIAGFLTGLLVYSGLSSANVALYVASRTLYGLTRNIDSTNRGWLSIFAIFGVVTPRTRIPIWSLLISTIIFATWMPFVKLSTGFTQAEVRYRN